ncbi:MAG: YaaL family protein [Oscillospiraceae bacterium]|jgi:hypothetical protein|nr:YaaL family protein [Oscillospiraceae bacterium]
MLYTSAKKEKGTRRDEWVSELATVKADIEHARARFNMATEEELIDQCVYELNALQARYTYFLRLIKESEV